MVCILSSVPAVLQKIVSAAAGEEDPNGMRRHFGNHVLETGLVKKE